MRNYKIWLLALGVATVFTAIMLVNQNTVRTEQKLNEQIKRLEHKTESEQRLEVENLKKQIQELDTKLQSKAAEKARLARIEADRASLAQKVVNSAIPTAQASGGSYEGVQGVIVKWANHYGVNAQHLLSIARCESTFNPNARNSSYSAGTAGNPVGLFQHVEGYWPARAAKYGVPGASIYDADAQARVTAAMFADGQAGLWECR